MTARVDVTIDVAVSPEAVWALISDLPRMGEWSPENESVTLRGASAPAAGVRFTGANAHGRHRWSTAGRITEFSAPHRLAFRITYLGLKVADWEYSIQPFAGGCRVTETWIDRRGAVFRLGGKAATGVADRASHNRDSMRATLEAIKAAAEAPGA